jgi:hypothetical protein
MVTSAPFFERILMNGKFPPPARSTKYWKHASGRIGHAPAVAMRVKAVPASSGAPVESIMPLAANAAAQGEPTRTAAKPCSRFADQLHSVLSKDSGQSEDTEAESDPKELPKDADSAVQSLIGAIPILRVDPELVPRSFAFTMPAPVVEKTKSTPDPTGISSLGPVRAGLPIILQQVNSTPEESANTAVPAAAIAPIIGLPFVEPLSSPPSAGRAEPPVPVDVVELTTVAKLDVPVPNVEIAFAVRLTEPVTQDRRNDVAPPAEVPRAALTKPIPEPGDAQPVPEPSTEPVRVIPAKAEIRIRNENGADRIAPPGKTETADLPHEAAFTPAPVPARTVQDFSRSEAASPDRAAEPALTTAPEPAISSPSARSEAVRDISVSIPPLEKGGNSAVALRLVEKAGEVHVSVRTADSDLGQSMRIQLDQLVTRFDRQGYRSEIWLPPSHSSATHDPSGEHGFSPRDSSYQGNGRQSDANQGQSGGQKRHTPERPLWLEEMDRRLNK